MYKFFMFFMYKLLMYNFLMYTSPEVQHPRLWELQMYQCRISNCKCTENISSTSVSTSSDRTLALHKYNQETKLLETPKKSIYNDSQSKCYANICPYPFFPKCAQDGFAFGICLDKRQAQIDLKTEPSRLTVAEKQTSLLFSRRSCLGPCLPGSQATTHTSHLLRKFLTQGCCLTHASTIGVQGQKLSILTFLPLPHVVDLLLPIRNGVHGRFPWCRNIWCFET